MKWCWLGLAAAGLLWGQATPQTPNLGLYIPIENTPNWNLWMNQNMTILDGLLGGFQVPHVRAGDVAIWDGTVWTFLAGNNTSNPCFTESSVGVPSWAACGTSVAFSAILGGASSAALTMGPGGSLTATGGTIAATFVPVSGVVGLSFTGNTTRAASSTGALTTGNCAKWDLNGNIIDSGSICPLPLGPPNQFVGTPVGGGQSLLVASPVVLASNFNFPPVAPGGTLTASVPATVTLTCPYGVAGTDTGHYLYISGGTGTAEAVLITGGSCMSGLSSGTLQFTPVYSHSGAWAITSASSGIAEAWELNKAVTLTAGAYNVYATITPPADATLTGPNEGSVTIASYNLSGSLFSVVNDRFTLSGMTLVQSGTAVSGSCGICAYGSTGSPPGTANFANIHDVYVYGFYNGVIASGGLTEFDMTRVFVANSVNVGAKILGSQGYWDKITLVNNTGDALDIGPAPTGGGGDFTFITDLQTYNNGGWGVNASSFVYISGADTFLNYDHNGELQQTITGPTDGGYFADGYVQAPGGGTTGGINATAPGVSVTSGAGFFTVQNVHFFNCEGNCIQTTGDGTIVKGNVVIGAGLGNMSGYIFALNSTAGNLLADGNRFESPVQISGNNNIFTDNQVFCNSTFSCLNVPSGLNQILNNNNLNNAGSGGPAAISSGVTVLPGYNVTSAGGGGANLASNVSSYSTNAPPQTLVVSYSTLTGEPAVAGSGPFYCNNCQTTATCTSGGTGHVAFYNGTNWQCN